MIKFIQRLIDKTDPLQAHIFIFIVVSLLLALSVFTLSIAALFVTKSLHTYIGIILPHLISLVGWNIYQNKQNNSQQPPTNTP